MESVAHCLGGTLYILNRMHMPLYLMMQQSRENKSLRLLLIISVGRPTRGEISVTLKCH